MKKSSLFLFTTLLFITSIAQNQDARIIDRIDPPNWFSGMENPTVELLIYLNSDAEIQFELEKKKQSIRLYQSC